MANKVMGTARTARRIRAQRRSVRIAPTMHTSATAATTVVRRIAVCASGAMNIVRFCLVILGPDCALPEAKTQLLRNCLLRVSAWCWYDDPMFVP